MATLTFPDSGRLLTLRNLTSNRLGVCGIVLGPNATRSISLRKVQGHRNHMSSMEALIAANQIQATLVSDVLSASDADVLDAAISGDLWLTRDVWNDVATNDVNAYKTSFTAPAAITTYSGTDLNGAIGQGEVDYARNVTITGTCGGGESLTEKNVVVVGTDINDQAQTETITASTGGQGPGGGAVTYQGAYAFKTVISAYFPAEAAGVPGAYEIGFGKKLGFSRPLTQGGLCGEFEDNTAISTGTVVLAATGAPNGTYSPANNPNDARDWVCLFVQS